MLAGGRGLRWDKGVRGQLAGDERSGTRGVTLEPMRAEIGDHSAAARLSREDLFVEALPIASEL